MSLDELFLLAQKGNGTAFERIVTMTEKQIYNLALSITRSHEDAEDVTQETYLRLWRARADFRGASVKSYIFRIAHNTAIDLMRKQSRIERTSASPYIDEDELARESIDPDPIYRPDEAYLRKLTAETVRSCINELPLPMRELIVMRDMDGLSYRDIASILGIPEGSVKSGIFRAREKLRILIMQKNIL